MRIPSVRNGRPITATSITASIPQIFGVASEAVEGAQQVSIAILDTLHTKIARAIRPAIGIKTWAGG
jgi:hypothetical protein